MFWCGDMNYRVDMSRQEVDKLLKKNDLKVSVVRKGDSCVICLLQAILLRDQLTREILSG